jgi:hypothetical protein
MNLILFSNDADFPSATAVPESGTGNAVLDFLLTTPGIVALVVVGLLIIGTIGFAVYWFLCRSRLRGAPGSQQYGQVIIDGTDDLAYGLETV